MNIESCDTCGNQTEPKISGSVSGMYCDTCNKWLVVTTYISTSYQDDTVYTMTFSSNQHYGKTELKALSRLMNMNFLQVKKYFESSSSYSKTGKAVDVLQWQKVITDTQVTYSINPDFNWVDADLARDQ